MKDAKVITICGSLKFQDTIMKISEELDLQGNCVLSIVYPTRDDKDSYNEEQFEILGMMHKQRIRMSDAIYVVNVNNYIGSGVREEIDYAKKLNKEIMYLEPIDE